MLINNISNAIIDIRYVKIIFTVPNFLYLIPTYTNKIIMLIAIGMMYGKIMLDNFTPEETKKAVEMIGGRYEIESSGGITFDTIRDYAECGVDFVSVGALTHSVKGLDMSFKAADSSKLKMETK